MIIRLKAYLMKRWANEFGLTIVKIKKIGNTEYLVCHDTEYLVCHDGALRKLATKEK